MILYYSPGVCSQAPHILMHELGFSHDSKRVNLKSKALEDGSSYLSINPKGAVPALELESGEVLTENAVILQYLGDRAGSADALPGVGDFRRYRVLEMVNFVATELHKRFSFLFNPDATDEMKKLVIRDLGRANASRSLSVCHDRLGGEDAWRSRSLAQPARIPRADAPAPVRPARSAVRGFARGRTGGLDPSC